MNRLEFMGRLKELLSDIPEVEQEEALQYYNDYFNDAGVENEQEIVASLDSPEKVAATIKEGLSGGEGSGEFTERGFLESGKKGTNQLIRRSGTAEQGTGDGEGGRAGGPEGFSGAAGAFPGSEERTGAGESGSFSGSSGGKSGEQGHPYGGGEAGKRKEMSGGMIALIVVLCVLFSPVIIGLAAALLGLLGGLAAAFAGIILAFAASGILCFVCMILLIIVGVSLLFPAPSAGVCILGGGLFVGGLALLFIWLTVWLCGRALPAMVMGIVHLFGGGKRKKA